MKSVPGSTPTYLRRVSAVESRLIGEDLRKFPYSLQFVRTLALEFISRVTIFVGENGSGKSTLLEAIADLCGLPVRGGGKTELPDLYAPDTDTGLSRVLRPSFAMRPHDGWFFRAEFQAQLASLLEDREKDPDFWANPYANYGGTSLHKRSHGEAFLGILLNRVHDGIVLLDEPESALSPERQLTLLTRIYDLAHGGAQFIIATHSPLLMTYPGATIRSFDHPDLPIVRLEDTSHYQVTRSILANPSHFWQRIAREKDV
ncbi:MAG: AAA family ATPase [Planctomycetota bacterium]